MNYIYLDNSATTKASDAAVAAVIRGLSEVYGNPSSTHRAGSMAAKELVQSREAVGAAMHAPADSVYFTSGGTMSDNIAILGGARKSVGNHVVTSTIEHPAVLNCFKALEASGFEVSYVKPDHEGIITAGAVAKVLKSNTSFVSIMHVNNETGAINPVEEIRKIVKQRCPRALFHTDAVQSFGKVPFYPVKWDIDLASVSAHKIHGPKGVGALYIKRGIKLNPVIHGGGQERGIMSGTENLPAIMGFAAACREISPENLDYVRNLSAFLKCELSEIENTIVNSPLSASPYIINLSFCGIPSEVVLNALSSEGIFVSAGSACSASKKGQSHVLREMGAECAQSAIRLSLSRLNTADEVRTAAETIKKIIPKLRRATRGYRKER